MSPPQPHRQNWRRLALGVCAVLLGGCAGLRVPRIDPTGERIFVWPQNQAMSVSPTLGVVQAPPVFTDPVFPQPTLPASFVPGAAAGAVQPVPTQVPRQGATLPGLIVPQDRLSITPDRVLAPVGSEVILRAGICTTENFLLTDQKVEWLIARESAGEIVDLGGKGYHRDPLLPWNKPKKIDNQYAIGYTAKVPLLITRGTADPSDDVQVQPGHSWASITSPVEGTSHITAVTPAIEAWAARRATATIYWVDVQWTFPPPQITAGGSQVMITTVRRQTDGTPLEGWIIRYEVAEGSGQLTGGQSGQIVEVVTGPDGRASIDVTPTGSVGAVTQINMQLVRPARLGGSDFPRLVVVNGVSTIHWTGQSTPYLPEPDDLGADFPTYPLPDRGPPFTGRPTAVEAVGRPALDLQILAESQVQVGGQTRFEVVIRNQGNGEATGIVLHDRFDPGLSHQMDHNRTLEIENSGVGNLAPGKSRSVFLDFEVLRSGRLCHDVTIRCKEGVEVSKRACINALQPAPRGRPELKLQKDGPALGGTLRLAIVSFSDPVRAGTRATYQILIENTAQTPEQQVQLRVFFPPELAPDVAAITNDANVRSTLDRNELRFEPIAQLRANERLEFLIPVSVNQPGVVNIVAQLTSRAVTTPVEKTMRVEILGR